MPGSVLMAFAADDEAAPAERGNTQLRSAVAQLEQTGLRSSQRIWRLLHSTQPLRDLRCVRRVLPFWPVLAPGVEAFAEPEPAVGCCESGFGVDAGVVDCCCCCCCCGVAPLPLPWPLGRADEESMAAGESDMFSIWSGDGGRRAMAGLRCGCGCELRVCGKRR